MPVRVPSFQPSTGDNISSNENSMWRIAKTVSKSKIGQPQQHKQTVGQAKRFSLLLDSIRRRSKSADPRGVPSNPAAKASKPHIQPDSSLPATGHLIDTALAPFFCDRIHDNHEPIHLRPKCIFVSDPPRGSLVSFRDPMVDHKYNQQSHCLTGRVTAGEGTITQSNICNQTSSQLRPTSFHPGMSEKPWQTATHFNPYLYQNVVNTSLSSNYAMTSPSNSSDVIGANQNNANALSMRVGNGTYLVNQLNKTHTGPSHKASVTLDSLSAYSDSKMHPCHRIRTANQAVSGRIARPISEFWPDPSGNWLINQSNQSEKGNIGKPLVIHQRSDWNTSGACPSSCDASFASTAERTLVEEGHESSDDIVTLKPSQSANVLQANDTMCNVHAYTPRWLLGRGVTAIHIEPYKANVHKVNGAYCSSPVACGCSPPFPRRSTVPGIESPSNLPVVSDRRLQPGDPSENSRAVWERRMQRHPPSESAVSPSRWTTGDKAFPASSECNQLHPTRGHLDRHPSELKCCNSVDGRLTLRGSTCSTGGQQMTATKPLASAVAGGLPSASVAYTTWSWWPGQWATSSSSRSSASHFSELYPLPGHSSSPSCDVGVVNRSPGTTVVSTSGFRPLANTTRPNGTSLEEGYFRQPLLPCNHSSNPACPGHPDPGTSRRPRSAMFIPAGCLPPPIGSQLIASADRTGRQLAARQPELLLPPVTTKSLVGVSRVIPNGTTLESFVGQATTAVARQQQQQRHSRSRQQQNQRQQTTGDGNRPPVTVRPPRPPLRTSSLVRDTGEKPDDGTSANAASQSSCLDVEQSLTMPLSPTSVRSARSTPNKVAPTGSVQPSSAAMESQKVCRSTAVPDTGHQPTPLSGSLPTTSSLSEATWWSHLLPYKASNLPTNLADRLRQRSSLVFSRPGSPQPDELARPHHLSSQFLAQTNGSDAQQMMTQSLYAQPPRRRSRTAIRPTSLCTERLYDRGGAQTAEAFHLPSLAHLTSSTQSVNKETATAYPGKSGACVRRTSVRPSSLALNLAPNNGTPSPPGSPSAQAGSPSTAPLPESDRNLSAPGAKCVLTASALTEHPSDSPVLGQYCRLLILRSTDSGLASTPTPTNAVAGLCLTGACRNSAGVPDSEVSTPSAGDLNLVTASLRLFKT